MSKYGDKCPSCCYEKGLCARGIKMWLESEEEA